MSEANIITTKAAKEAFVTGHAGSSWQLIFLVSVAAPLGCLASAVMISKFKKDNTSKFQSVLIEAVLTWIPVLLMQSEYALSYGILTLVLQASIVVLWYPTTREHPDSPYIVRASSSPTLMPALTVYRSSILWLTLVAILAVDFSIFPRSFCKTETQGYGLMDLGAASFCLSAGLPVGKRRRWQKQASNSWKSILSLILLGVIRLVTNKGLEYQEHVSEYGVHWNFFFTLAFLVMLAPTISVARVGIVAGGLWMALLVYQGWLSMLGGQDFVEKAPRHCPQNRAVLCDFFYANREGILGCLGYAVLYVSGIWIGSTCLWSRASRRRLWSVAFGGMLLHAVIVSILQMPVSRRSTNLGFVTWALAHNVVLLAGLQSVWQEQQQHLHVPPMCHALNRFGLLAFVGSNLLTGLVNLTVDTLHASNTVAFGVLVAYLTIVGGLAVVLDHVRQPKGGMNSREAQETMSKIEECF